MARPTLLRRLLSLAPGGALADAVGVQPVFWIGGALLALAGALGLALLGGHDVRARRAARPQPSSCVDVAGR